MAAINDCMESFDLTDGCNTKNNLDSSDVPVLPSGEHMNNSSILKSSGNENVDTEPCERRKKTRRGKPKRKNPYNKEGNETRKAGNRSKNRPRFAHRHADAPYNTNEFLMEDHNTFVKVNSPPAVSTSVGNSRPPRVRDPSFTSVDSDEDHFYSSPEDEEEFLTKEFSNTYQDLHVETLQGMTKSELIQQVLQLEEKVDGLEKRLGNRPKSEKDQYDKLKNSVDTSSEDCDKTSDKIKQFQIEIGRLRLENEKLQLENEILRRRNRSSSVSSVDSERDSTSSSSPSSVSELSDKEELIEADVNEDMDDSRGKCSVPDEFIDTDVAMKEKEV
ncbi:protein HEXIM1 [Homalodisca vitripennis]|uniref:Uncharacterized protein n=1 Tax=Homalodisca liturata TaxID=320908 RepID=A0A1B6IY24_9HEMI|nr:protein HEXIM1 [Homalodisca vitripennis]KAG8289885.1 7SK snRNA binding [Homalodisca vitripennis]KAG8302662.1 7SK snRNA binding [Homalodisca vitripennis]